MKWTLSQLLFCLLSFFQIQFSFAQTEPELESSGTRYEIDSYDDLLFISQNDSWWDKSFIVTNAIDATPSGSGDALLAFSPIGNSTVAFTGNFDGGSDAGHVISNLYISQPAMDNVGMFGYLNNNGAVVKKVILEDFFIEGQNNVGAIAGYIEKGNAIKKIELRKGAGNYSVNVRGGNNTGGVVGYNEKGNIEDIVVSELTIEHTTGVSAQNLGGVVGLNSNSATGKKITRITMNDVVINTDNNRVGGVAGKTTNGTDLSEVEINGLTINAVSHAGGIVGQNKASTVSTITVVGLDIIVDDQYAGGIVGKNDEGSTIEKAVVSGKIKGKRRIGGITGDNNSSSSVNMSNAFIEFTLQTDATLIGGVVGGNYTSATITESYAVTKVANIGNLLSGGIIGGVTANNGNQNNISDTYFDISDEYMGNLGEPLYDVVTNNQMGVQGYATSLFEDMDNFNFTGNWGIRGSEADPYQRPYLLDMDGLELPVELIAFFVEVEDDVISVNWTTATEVNNDFFVLDYSYDRKKWEEVAVINGNGNKQTRTHYMLEEALDNYRNGIVFYRLKQVDFDGKSTYYYLEVNLNHSTQNIKIYPTITDDIVTVIRTDNRPIQIFNHVGKDYSTQVGIDIDQKLTQLSLSKLPEGWYIIKVHNSVKRVYRR
ncbi:hypothetical protein [Flammeovirga sp. SJP92]|uniref:hypothetical protein n=1 Tax=Flammeovirga sp. SJP92 TaxID=1775430 RepID=UPI0007876D95|nr:hypothetical protein [Flammeovirga sp. SJP92]KXX67156.1 hypothetical protein AVL50_27600 [Flammeovirga sp. SJP92]